MYFLKDMVRIVKVEPMFLGPSFKEHVQRKLKADIEGKCDASGYYLCVNEFKDFEKGRCQDGTGMVVLRVWFQALVYQAIPFESVDAIVSQVNTLGLFCQSGPLQIFLSAQHLNSWDFVDGPPPKYTSTDTAAVLQEGTCVRVRVFSVSPEGGWLKGVGQLEAVRDE
eukprot:GDKJ01032595.1.p1 GENE.GDKJ01032595.1~~GDKJ01032595.1.p1  ORF type:complete len:167 (+),score=21.67 GDKJ01032595.1:55-555(+)